MAFDPRRRVAVAPTRAARARPAAADDTSRTSPRPAHPSAGRTLLHDPRLGGRGNGSLRATAMLQLQGTLGNRATQRLLQAPAPQQTAPRFPRPLIRQVVQRHAGSVLPQVPVQRHDPQLDEDLPIQSQRLIAVQTWPGESKAQRKARYEQMAQATQACFAGLFTRMVNHTNGTIREVGRYYQHNVIELDPITRRSDSAKLVQDNGDNPKQDAYFFTGVAQNNARLLNLHMAGLATGGRVYLRGHNKSNSKVSDKRMIDIAVHEAMHIRHSTYKKQSIDIFKRYKDEFRAYWTQPYAKWKRFGPLTAAQKAEKIKRHIVGASLTSTKCYDYARDAYHDPNHPEHATFRANVDNFVAPEPLPSGEGPAAFQLARMIKDYAILPNGEQDLLQYIQDNPGILDMIQNNAEYEQGIRRALNRTIYDNGAKGRVLTALGL
jgi:hypothetical protein